MNPRFLPVLTLLALAGVPIASAGELDQPFFQALAGEWSGTGSMTAGGNTAPIDPARIRAEATDGKFKLEGDITIGGELGLYSMTFAEARGAITVSYANSDGASANLTATIDRAGNSAKVVGSEREFTFKLAADTLRIELKKTGADAATAILNLKRGKP